MLAQLLSSKPKSKLINLLLGNPGRSFSATELRITAYVSSAFLKKTLRELQKMDFLLVTEKKKHKYYQVNRHFALYPELINMLRKNKTQVEDVLAKASTKVGECKYIALTGVFVGKPRIETDLLFVGRISPRKLEQFLRLAEKFAEQEVSYTVFTTNEFDYRIIMNDRFLKNIIENSPVVVLDKVKNKKFARPH
jgi:hypothetical protein